MQITEVAQGCRVGNEVTFAQDMLMSTNQSKTLYDQTTLWFL